jgi:invasion protein IalB
MDLAGIGHLLSIMRRPLLLVVLALALPAGGGSAEAQTRSIKAAVHGDWRVACDSAARCFATHQAGGLAIVVGRAADTRMLRAALVVGKDTKVGAPVTILLDTNVAIELLVTGCEATGCEAAVDAAKTRLVTDAFKQAETGVVAYMAGERIRMLRFSLRGSSAAIGAVGG